jgi:hypothetical protein
MGFICHYLLLDDPHNNCWKAREFMTIIHHLPDLWASLILFGSKVQCLSTPITELENHLSRNSAFVEDQLPNLAEPKLFLERILQRIFKYYTKIADAMRHFHDLLLR